MKKLRLFGVFCACVITLLFGNFSHAATVQYVYTGNTFGNTAMPQCPSTDCFSITATIDLSDTNNTNLTLTDPVIPLAWSISDGLTTITDQTAGFYLYTLNLRTDVLGNISQWNFVVANIPPHGLYELESMQTTFGAGITAADYTGYCTSGTAAPCSSTLYARLENNTGTWIVTTVPLPAAAWLFGSGILGLIGIGRKRRHI